MNFSIFIVVDSVEQRTCIQFYLWNEYSFAEGSWWLNCGIKKVYKWYNDFEAARERNKGEPRTGRPSTSTDKGHSNKSKIFCSKIEDWQLETSLIVLEIIWLSSNHSEECFVSQIRQVSIDFFITIMHHA